jgi:hypothetical protein
LNAAVLPLARIPVGVVVERRKAKSPWIEHVWRPVTVLPGVPETAPWTLLSEDKDCATFYVGGADIELFPSDTTQYRDNLMSGTPSLWVALRPTGSEPPYKILTVTADPAEGEGLTEPGTDLIEPVPMPDLVADAVAAFVTQHHVERVFFKRKRDRVDPESFARRPVIRESKTREQKK